MTAIEHFEGSPAPVASRLYPELDELFVRACLEWKEGRHRAHCLPSPCHELGWTVTWILFKAHPRDPYVVPRVLPVVPSSHSRVPPCWSEWPRTTSPRSTWSISPIASSEARRTK